MNLRRAVISTMLCGVAVRLLGAQELRGLVRDSAGNQPIPGAVLLLLDSTNTVLGRNITNERGEFRVALTDAMRRLRVQRIGFRPRELDIPILTTGVAELNVVMRALPTMLEPIHVSAGAQCPKRSDAEATFALLEQVRTGLLATIVAREANPGLLVTISFDREMDGGSDRATSQRVRLDTMRAASRSFVAAQSASDFVRRGFMNDSAGQQLFFGPDAEVMLDEAFAAGYCFRITARDRARPTQVGLGFSAAERRRGRVDIAGTLWVDTAARALRDIEYRFVGLEPRADALRPGGHTGFRELGNGMVLIDRWHLRLASREADTARVGSRDQIRDWFRATENGGELVRATWPDGYSWHATLGLLRGRVVGRDGGPAAGVNVHLKDSPYRATTDSAGQFEISDLLPGPYLVRVADARLAPIAFEVPTMQQFMATRDTLTRTIALPTLEDFIIDRCAEDRRYSVGASVLLIGRAMTGNASAASGLTITMRRPSDPIGTKSLPDTYKPGSEGMFQFCGHGLETGMTVVVEAWRNGVVVGATTVRLTEKITVVKLAVPSP